MADNGSSTSFIDHVNPEIVIASAGRGYSHPRQMAADRFLLHGVKLSNMFRTDRGDDEGEEEWTYTRINGCRDKSGDDDIHITLRSNGTMAVYYVNQFDPCIPGH
jgi:hypothetical protein